MLIKCRHEEFDVNETDLVMYNGACYQLVTKQSYRGWDWSYPLIAKSKAEKMIRDGLMVLKNEKDDHGMKLLYYTFKESV